MSAAQSLIKSYSFASRKRVSTPVRSDARHVPAGLSFSRRHAALPLRKQVVFLESRVERVGGRVMARCFSISRAGSALFSSSMMLTSQSSLLRHAIEGVLRTSGSFSSKWAADATAGLMKDVLGETAEHLHRCASQDMGRVAQAGGFAIVDWLAKMDKALLARLAAYSAVVDTPVHQYWEDFLDNVIMPADPNSPVAVAMKVLLDQGLMAPMATALMILVFKLLEGKKHDLANDFHQQLLERLVPDWAVWPMARVIEFTLVPQESRPLFEGMVGVFSFGLGMFKLRKKLESRLQTLPRNVKQATSQGLEASLADSADELQPKSTSPFARSSWEGFARHHRAAFRSPLGRFSASVGADPLRNEEDTDAASASHRCRSAPIASADNRGNNAARAGTLTDAFAGEIGLAAAAAALRGSGIIAPCGSDQPRNPTVRVPGLVRPPANLHTPFSALAQEPMRFSTDSAVEGSAHSGSHQDSGRSLNGIESVEQEHWNGLQGKMSRLAVVSGAGQ